jgi:preprotein translocase subunit Sec63
MVPKLRNPVPQSLVFSEHVSKELLTYFRVGNYFLLLDLTPNANPGDLKKAYRRLAKKYHPDANVGASEEEMKSKKKAFQALQEAYEQLLTILE